MLTPPTKGFARSVNTHNVELDAITEWIEGCITFVDDEISKNDVKDILHEEIYYPDQDFAQERIDDAWGELRRRQRCLGPCCGYRVETSRIVSTSDWKDVPAYSFCLMLALQIPYRAGFLAKFASDYTEQGLLFERLTAESLDAMGWSTHSTGWSHTTSNSIADKVAALAAHIGEPQTAGAVERWTEERAKDGGLDVVCHFPFNDGWAGRPVYFVQCASGENWKDKRHTPVLAHWEKLIDLATKPRRGIAHPFVLLEDDFRRAVNFDLLSLVLDRQRLCRPTRASGKDWVSAGLVKDLNIWTKKRVQVLLKSKC